jgi:metaxin
MSGRFELDIWSGDWGLPSIDFSCLQILSYCRFSGVPVKTNQRNNPFWSSLPSFRHTNVKLNKLSEVIQHLKSHNYSADFNLSPKDSADVTAYTALLKQQLEPALLYLFWVDETNYVELMRGWYAKRLPFPTNYFIPNQYRSAAEKCIRARFGVQVLDNSESNAIIENAIIGEAQKCLTLLSERLKDEFFFGKNPTSFDAVVFGYLAPLLKVPVHNRVLQNHIKSCDNLYKFVNSILHKYFPTIKESDSKLTSDDKKNSESDESEDFPHKWRDIILSALFATTAMVGYALAVGLVKIDVDHDTDYVQNEPSVHDLQEIFEDYEEESEEKDN